MLFPYRNKRSPSLSIDESKDVLAMSSNLILLSNRSQHTLSSFVLAISILPPLGPPHTPACPAFCLFYLSVRACLACVFITRLAAVVVLSLHDHSTVRSGVSRLRVHRASCCCCCSLPPRSLYGTPEGLSSARGVRLPARPRAPRGPSRPLRPGRRRLRRRRSGRPPCHPTVFTASC